MCLLLKSVQLFSFEVTQGEKAHVSLWFGILERVHCLLGEKIIKSYPNREAQMQLVCECHVICADVNRCTDEVRILWPGAFAEHTWSWCAIDGA